MNIDSVITRRERERGREGEREGREGGRLGERERESQIQVGICYHQPGIPTVANTHWVFSTAANTHHRVFATINEYLLPVANTHCEYLLPY